MKRLIARIVTVVLATVAIAGCNGTILQESAMEWMQRQPWTSDGPP